MSELANRTNFFGYAERGLNRQPSQPARPIKDTRFYPTRKSDGSVRVNGHRPSPGPLNDAHSFNRAILNLFSRFPPAIANAHPVRCHEATPYADHRGQH